ncbi:unnamed protein product, partial [Staurois parvus]
PQSLVIPCTVSAVSGHPPALCPQSLVIPCTVSTVSGHLLYYVRSLWSSPVLCPQSLVIPCTVSAVHWFRIFFFLVFPLKPRCVLWSGASYGAKNTV